MNLSLFNPTRYKKTVKRIAAVMLALWTALIALSLYYNLDQHDQTLVRIARETGRIAFEKDLLYRGWNSGHGGVYVPVTETSQPNPYLVLPDRNITDTFGAAYTLINPAYMTRQVFEMQEKDTGIVGHITSLNPIRPENAADEWETRALRAFEEGAREVSSVETVGGEEYLRLMKPLFVEKSCLDCHAAQGYQIGQIRGGISESVPLKPLEEAGFAQRGSLFLAHGFIWVVGLLGIYFGSRTIQHSVTLQQQAEEELLFLSHHDSLTGLHNRHYFEDYFRQLEENADRPATVLSCDLDNLKHTNDSMGHAAGDLLLQGAAGVLRASFRAEDVIARVGGDEFVVVLQGGSQEQVAAAIERVRAHEEAWNREHPGMNLSISIGAASTAKDMNLKGVLKLADDRMYADKARRKAAKG